MKIGILSDTHGYLDPKVLHHFQSCDQIWHAGDIGNCEIVKNLRDFKETKMVWGNIDGREIQALVPGYQFFEIEGKNFLIVHIPGRKPHYTKEIQKIWGKHGVPDVMICGHSHILKVEQDLQNGLLFVNPGACGLQGFHKIRTLIRFEIEEGRLFNMQAIELGKRGEA